MEYVEPAQVEMNYYILSLELEQSKAQIQPLEGHISNLDLAFKALEEAMPPAFILSKDRTLHNETIFMKPDYANAHGNLASALHAMGEDERAIEVFQKAIDLKLGHVDALYIFGGLYVDSNGEEAFIVVEASTFKTIGEKTVLRPELSNALKIRSFHKITKLNRYDVELIKKEISEHDVSVSYSGGGVPKKSICKPSWKKFFVDYFVREKVSTQNVELQEIHTNEPVVDIFTKALTKVKFEVFRKGSWSY